MLTQEERQAISDLIEHSPDRRSACVEALTAVQERRGYVSDEVLEELAALLEMTPTELDGVATFYNLVFRRPTGRHVILVCDSISCWVCGQENLMAHLSRTLGVRPGETTQDGIFTLLTVPCLGACDRAPTMLIDDELYGNLTAEKVEAVLTGYRQTGG